MRRPSYESRISVTTGLLIVLGVVFVVQKLVETYTAFPVTAYFYLSLQGLAHGYVWQLLTFQFLHASVMHILLNGIAIYFFGKAMEEVLGGKRMLALYFSSGVVGGLFQMVFALLWPNYFGGAVLGASAGAFGLVAAFATLFPERPITLLLFFIIPFTMRARTLLWGALALAGLGIMVHSPGIAHAAHFGGILTGVCYVYGFVQGKWSHLTGGVRRHPRRTSRQLVRSTSVTRSFWARSKPEVEEDEDLPPAEFISKEVDPILDKISAHGIHSLTARERRILEAARAKMAKR